MLKIRDPLVEMKIGKRNLIMNLSHELPLNMTSHRYYNTALGRIAAFLSERDGYLTMIDVGANIGDTVSLISDTVSGRFLCIDADDKYYEPLLVNTKGIDNVYCVKALCDESEGESTISLDSARGSSQISGYGLEGTDVINRATLDGLVKKLPVFRDVNFIKIDTDGYDYKVIRGCNQLIADNKPIFFFELAPMFLRNAGENPLSIFEYFSNKGYRKALFYDHAGYPIIIIDVNDEKIHHLVQYADIKGTYFDVLVFHNSREDDFGLFRRTEEDFFENSRQ